MSRDQEPLGLRILGWVILAIILHIMLPVLLLPIIPALILSLAYRLSLYVLIWLVWLPKGRDVLVIYSDSPIWCDYMKTQIIPIVQKRATVLNWSERQKWPKWSLAISAFGSFGGEREFNPL